MRNFLFIVLAIILVFPYGVYGEEMAQPEEDASLSMEEIQKKSGENLDPDKLRKIMEKKSQEPEKKYIQKTEKEIKELYNEKSLKKLEDAILQINPNLPAEVVQQIKDRFREIIKGRGSLPFEEDGEFAEAIELQIKKKEAEMAYRWEKNPEKKAEECSHLRERCANEKTYDESEIAIKILRGFCKIAKKKCGESW